LLCSSFRREEHNSLVYFNDGGTMHVRVAIYGAARVIIGQPLVELSFHASSITLGQLLEEMSKRFPRARPYLLDEAGKLPSYMRVLINNRRPDPDATPATAIHDGDHVALMVAVAGGVYESGERLESSFLKKGMYIHDNSTLRAR
jgi:molybdopterin converting factor small subunit